MIWTNEIFFKKMHSQFRPPHRISVYNCGTGYLNPITWGKFINEAMKFVKKYPSQRSIWYPGLTASANSFKYEACVWIYHYLPAYLLDTVARLTRRRPILVSLNLKYLSQGTTGFVQLRTWSLDDLLLFGQFRLFDLSQSFAVIVIFILIKN